MRGAGGSDSSLERRHSLRVLVVDDNSTSQQAMRRMIINAGMHCDVAGRAWQILLATTTTAL